MAHYLRTSLTLMLTMIVLACPCFCLGGKTLAPRSKAGPTCCRHCRQAPAPADDHAPLDAPRRDNGSCLCAGALAETGLQFDLFVPNDSAPFDAQILPPAQLSPPHLGQAHRPPSLGPPGDALSGRALRLAIESLTI
jgi:hypothetical protein